MANIIPQFSDQIFRDKSDRRKIQFKQLDIGRGKNGVEFPAEGGILTYFVGEKYPWKGFSHKEPVLRGPLDAITEFKRVLLGIIRFLTSKPIRYFLPILAIMPFRKRIIWSFLAEMMDVLDATLHEHYLKPELFCDSGREIYKIGNAISEDFGGNKGNYSFKGRIAWRLTMAICMIWEFDEVYRLPSQDLFGELNIKALLENPAKELERLLTIAISRTPANIQKAKWNKMRLVIRFSSFIFRKEFKKLAELVASMDLDKMRLDEADNYHTLIRTYYFFGGVSFEQRFAQRKQIDEEYNLIINKNQNAKQI